MLHAAVLGEGLFEFSATITSNVSIRVEDLPESTLQALTKSIGHVIQGVKRDLHLRQWTTLSSISLKLHG